MWYLSKLEHIAYYKAKNQNAVKTNLCVRTCTHAYMHSTMKKGTNTAKYEIC